MTSIRAATIVARSPEGVALGEVDGHSYAFIGLERIGGRERR